MDATAYVSNNVTVELVRASPSKRLVLLSAGVEKLTQEGKKKINFLAEIDGKQRNYTPNAATLKNLISAYGGETNNWIGKQVKLDIQVLTGKEAVVGSAA